MDPLVYFPVHMRKIWVVYHIVPACIRNDHFVGSVEASTIYLVCIYVCDTLCFLPRFAIIPGLPNPIVLVTNKEYTNPLEYTNLP